MVFDGNDFMVLDFLCIDFFRKGIFLILRTRAGGLQWGQIPRRRRLS
jgi:hypothetical protein